MTTPHSDPERRFKDLVQARVANGMTRAQATSDVARRHPELRAAYVKAVNDRVRLGR